MLNVKKGVLHSLQQTDYRGVNPNPTGYGSGGTIIYAGNLVYVATSGTVTLSPTSGGASWAAGPLGFSINSNFDGDAIESKTIAIYALDGASIIETDQVDLSGDSVTAISATNYPVGTLIYPSSNTSTGLTTVGTVTYANGTAAGMVAKTNGSSSNAWPRAIGVVVGVRYLQNATPYPSGISGTQNYTSATETAAYNAESTSAGTGQPIYTPSTVSNTYKYQANVPVLGIKLFANY